MQRLYNKVINYDTYRELKREKRRGKYKVEKKAFKTHQKQKDDQKLSLTEFHRSICDEFDNGNFSLHPFVALSSHTILPWGIN